MDHIKLKIGDEFDILYMKDTRIKFIEIHDREFGKKLTTPLFTFLIITGTLEGKTFKNKDEDVQKAFKFLDWKKVEK